MEKETKEDIIGLSIGYLGIVVLALLLSTQLSSAMYAGECDEIDLSELNSFEDILYIVVGNSSNMTGMNITFDSITKNASVCFVVNYKPDNFTLVFFDNVTNEKIVYRSSGSRTKYIDRNITQNQTVYVPEYVDKEVEVEKIVDNTTVIQTGFELWNILLAIGVGILFGMWILSNWRKNE